MSRWAPWNLALSNCQNHWKSIPCQEKQICSKRFFQNESYFSHTVSSSFRTMHRPCTQTITSNFQYEFFKWVAPGKVCNWTFVSNNLPCHVSALLMNIHLTRFKFVQLLSNGRLERKQKDHEYHIPLQQITFTMHCFHSRLIFILILTLFKKRTTSNSSSFNI